MLSNEYLKGNTLTPYEAGVEERVRPTTWSATALLARVYLYSSDWLYAEFKQQKFLTTQRYLVWNCSKILLQKIAERRFGSYNLLE